MGKIAARLFGTMTAEAGNPSSQPYTPYGANGTPLPYTDSGGARHYFGDKGPTPAPEVSPERRRLDELRGRTQEPSTNVSRPAQAGSSGGREPNSPSAVVPIPPLNMIEPEAYESGTPGFTDASRLDALRAQDPRNVRLPPMQQPGPGSTVVPLPPRPRMQGNPELTHPEDIENLQSPEERRRYRRGRRSGPPSTRR